MSTVGPIGSCCLDSLEPYLPEPNQPRNASSANSGHLPHVTLTYAQTLDSKISLHPNTRTNISGAETKAMTHYLRTRHDAILVGVGTANADDPGLNSRYSLDRVLPKLESQPRPIILDSRMKWQPTSESKVLELAKYGLGKTPWWIVDHGQIARNQDKVRMIRGIGGEVIEVRPRDWSSILASLGGLGIRSVMVEGGAGVINGLLEARNQKYVPRPLLEVFKF
jgi:2,5-diamino-6-(ribosylamino)-4(3H)-pyrimidinone 5'-phosphate reductase